jgi:hypothetical protein
MQGPEQTSQLQVPQYEEPSADILVAMMLCRQQDVNLSFNGNLSNGGICYLGDHAVGTCGYWHVVHGSLKVV